MAGPQRRRNAGATPGRRAVVYFSRPGENYWHGGRRDLKVGNTQVVAEQIARLVDAEMIRLEAADPYPHDYEQTVERNQSEQLDDARPRIAGGVPDLSPYDTVILGCPVWNTRAPMIIRTLLDAADLSGVTIHPFTTYAVGQGSVFPDYAEQYPNPTIAQGLAIQGEKAADSVAEIAQWVRRSSLGKRRIAAGRPRASETTVTSKENS